MSVNSKMTAIADEIRAKTGGTEPLTLDGMAESIPEVYSAGQSSMVDESKLIPKAVSGSYISVDDVSEIPHSVACKVESVNLCPEEVESGYYYDAAPTISGAYERFVRIRPFAVEPSTAYAFSSNLSVYSVWFCNESGGIRRLGSSGSANRIYFTTPDNCTELRISLNNTSGAADTVAFEYAMLNKGTTALPYTPYVKPEEVKVTRCGANLLPVSNNIMFTQSGWKNFETPLPAGTYTFSGKFSTDNPNNVMAFTARDENGVALFWSNVRISETGYHSCTVTTNAPMSIVYWYSAEGYPQGVGIKASIHDFQINAGKTALPYEPYNGQTLTPATDGTVEGMTSVSPYMNIFSDTEGVNIEATYNKSYGMQTEWDRYWDKIQNNGNSTDYEYRFFGFPYELYDPKYDFVFGGGYSYAANCTFRNNDFVDLKRNCDFSAVDSRVGLTYTFHSATRLVNARTLKVTEKLSYTSTFYGCTALAEIRFEGVIGTSIDFRYSPLTKASITNIINTLSSTATGQTLTLKLSAVNTAFKTSAGANDGSTSAEFAALVATKTNWTITMI